MPGYKAHISGGLAFYGVTAGLMVWLDIYRAPLPQALMMAAFAVLGAMFPDVDTSSKGRHLYYAALVLADVVLILREKYKWAAILGLCGLLPALGAHRGWTHTWWAMLLVPAPILILPEMFASTPWNESLPLYTAFALGYLSHLVLDSNFS